MDGNYRLRAGIWGEFLDSLVMHYGGSDSLKTGWVSNVLFEPAVGNDLFHRMAAAEPLLTVKHGTAFVDARREKGRWIVRTEHAGKTETVEARVLIDATEQGDVARALGVPYDIGMESREATDEDIAPETANGIVQDAMAKADEEADSCTAYLNDVLGSVEQHLRRVLDDVHQNRVEVNSNAGGNPPQNNAR